MGSNPAVVMLEETIDQRPFSPTTIDPFPTIIQYLTINFESNPAEAKVR